MEEKKETLADGRLRTCNGSDCALMCKCRPKLALAPETKTDEETPEHG